MTMDPLVFLVALAQRWHEQGLAGPSEHALMIPAGVEVGSNPHLLFLTLPRAISALQDEVELWERAALAWASAEAQWLFDPAQVAYAEWPTVETALRQWRLASRRQESRGWYEVARGLQGRFKGDIRAMVEAGGGRTSGLLAYLAKSPSTFPFLSGEETSRLWLEQLRRIGGLSIEEDEPLCLVPSQRAREAAASQRLDPGPEALPAHHVLALEVWAALSTRDQTQIAAAIQKAL
ncbi:MAG: hypothetical protein H0T73_22990 [Ardenticatenales bacterium]|nr:hypothetical protein [Ardenticatenales bacterium]